MIKLQFLKGIFIGRRKSRKNKVRNKDSCEIKPKIDLVNQDRGTLESFSEFNNFTPLRANEFPSFQLCSYSESPEYSFVQHSGSESLLVQPSGPTLKSYLSHSSPESSYGIPSNFDITNLLNK